MSRGCLVCQQEVVTFLLSMPVSQSPRKKGIGSGHKGSTFLTRSVHGRNNAGGPRRAVLLPLLGMMVERNTISLHSIPTHPIPRWNSKRTGCQHKSMCISISMKVGTWCVTSCHVPLSDAYDTHCDNYSPTDVLWLHPDKHQTNLQLNWRFSSPARCRPDITEGSMPAGRQCPCGSIWEPPRLSFVVAKPGRRQRH